MVGGLARFLRHKLSSTLPFVISSNTTFLSTFGETLSAPLSFSQTLTSKSGLRSHKRAHRETDAGKKKFSCDECDYQCHQKYLLNRHKV